MNPGLSDSKVVFMTPFFSVASKELTLLFSFEPSHLMRKIGGQDDRPRRSLGECCDQDHRLLGPRWLRPDAARCSLLAAPGSVSLVVPTALPSSSEQPSGLRRGRPASLWEKQGQRAVSRRRLRGCVLVMHTGSRAAPAFLTCET